ARRRENEAKHTAARQPSNYHAAEAECRIIPCVKLNYCTILESRRRCTGQHKPNVLNMAVGCANAGSDMLAPAPAWLIRRPTNGHAAETHNLETPLLEFTNFVWCVESLQNYL